MQLRLLQRFYTLAVQLARGRAPQRTRCSQQPACATRRGARRPYVECWSFLPCSASFGRTYAAEFHPAAQGRAGRARGSPRRTDPTGVDPTAARRPPLATHVGKAVYRADLGFSVCGAPRPRHSTGDRRGLSHTYDSILQQGIGSMQSNTPNTTFQIPMAMRLYHT